MNKELYNRIREIRNERLYPDGVPLEVGSKVYVIDNDMELVDKEVCTLDLSKDIKNQDKEVLEAIIELIK